MPIERCPRTFLNALWVGMFTFTALTPSVGEAQPISTEIIAVMEARCERGQGDYCAALVELFTQGTHAPRDLPRAARFARRGCQLGHALSCKLQPELDKLLKGEQALGETRAEFEAIVAPSIAQCEQGEVLQCMVAAFGYSIASDSQKARADLFLDKACALDGTMACAAARYYSEHVAATEPQIKARLLETRFYQRACEKACERNSLEACADLAKAYAFGEFMPKDLARAVPLYSKACDKGYLYSCGSLGMLYATGQVENPGTAQVMHLLRKGCEGAHPGACLGMGLAYKQGRGMPKDEQKAREFHQRACELGIASACDKAAPLASKGMDGGSGKSSLMEGLALRPDAGVRSMSVLESLTLRLDGGSPSPPAGSPAQGTQSGNDSPLPSVVITMFEERCQEGSGEHCLMLARLFAEGKQVPRNAARAREFAARGCERKSQGACTLREQLEQDALRTPEDPR